MATLNMVQAIRSTLEREMERDERIILLGQDIGHNGGMFRATCPSSWWKACEPNPRN